VSRIQYWTSKINNIVKEIHNIKNTFKNCKNNQNSPDRYGGDEKGSKYSYGNNLKYHDRTSNHDTLEHHGQPPNHNDPNTSHLSATFSHDPWPYNSDNRP